jgi:hypothetical protein
MYYDILNKAVVKGVNSIFWHSCPYCDGSQIEDDIVEVRCLDCGMGKYKEGRHRTYRKLLQEYPHVAS